MGSPSGCSSTKGRPTSGGTSNRRRREHDARAPDAPLAQGAGDLERLLPRLRAPAPRKGAAGDEGQPPRVGRRVQRRRRQDLARGQGAAALSGGGREGPPLARAAAEGGAPM